MAAQLPQARATNSTGLTNDSLNRDTGDASSTDLEIEGSPLKLSSIKAIDPVSGKSLEVVAGRDGKLVVRGIPMCGDGIGVVKIEAK